MKIELNIEGMHCEKCAARLQKALEAQSGVNTASVSIDTKKAVVDFNDQQVSLNDLKSVVDDCGFSVVE